MAKLEELSSGASVRGIAGDAIATIVNVNWYGSNCIDVVYKTADGRVANDILYRDERMAGWSSPHRDLLVGHEHTSRRGRHHRHAAYEKGRLFRAPSVGFEPG